MLEWLVGLFIASQTLMGVVQTPQEESNVWSIDSAWENSSLVFIAKADLSNINCQPGHKLVLPTVLYGEQYLKFGNKKLSYNGSKSLKHVFNRPFIDCKEFIGHNEGSIEWGINAYSEYFSMVSEWPKIKEPGIFDHLAETMYIGTTLTLFIFGFFITFTLYNREIKLRTVLISFSSFFAASYFLFSSADKYGIDLDILTINKIADICLSISFILLNICFLLNGLLSRKLLSFIIASSIFGISIVLIAQNGDEVQLGTSAQFVGIFLALGSVVFKSFVRLKKNWTRQHFAEHLCALLFFSFTMAEMAIFSGALNMASYIPVGLLFGYFMFVFSINQKIRQTYKERDELFNQMEEKVRSRTTELRKALDEKDHAQAELIESAKLASLGTLSAGIAHEINNSINYVNSCVFGLEKQINSAVPKEDPHYAKIMKLISTIRHGAKMTIDIVASLRNYTGLNQSKMKALPVGELVNSVKTIIRSKIGSVQVDENYDPNLQIYGSISGLNQVLMNLIINALDAVDKNTGIISIEAHENNQGIEIRVSDNGVGIPIDIQAQIFDPFFTTKDVGDGTGLGLHISKKEIEIRHKGKLSLLKSDPSGTTFSIELPRDPLHLESAA